MRDVLIEQINDPKQAVCRALTHSLTDSTMADIVLRTMVYYNGDMSPEKIRATVLQMVEDSELIAETRPVIFFRVPSGVTGRKIR